MAHMIHTSSASSPPLYEHIMVPATSARLEIEDTLYKGTSKESICFCSGRSALRIPFIDSLVAGIRAFFILVIMKLSSNPFICKTPASFFFMRCYNLAVIQRPRSTL